MSIALEALISSLRSHLTRLTAELSSHQELLFELRTSRESDSKALKDKSAEVQLLREEVERLAGEVEVLRGVVEEGLRERRAAREASEDLAAQSREEEEPEEEETEEEDEDEAEPFDPQSIPGSSREHFAGLDRTLRTDHATAGSPPAPETPQQQRQKLIDDEEFERISAEVAERRSERERSRSGSTSMGSNSHLQSYFVSGDHSREDPSIDQPLPPPKPRSVHGGSDAGDLPSRAASPRLRANVSFRTSSPGPSRMRQSPFRAYNESLPIEQPSGMSAAPIRPSAPTPGHAKRRTQHSHHHPRPDMSSEAPFPKIRGARLERLFFSAEHNAKTCSMCNRRARRPGGAPAEEGGRPLSPSWLPSRMGKRATDVDDEDEGFVEGDEVDGRRRVAPQTVLANVIKEMEEDFGHYKRFVFLFHPLCTLSDL